MLETKGKGLDVQGRALLEEEADTAQTSREALADTIEKMGYAVSATEVQQYAADEALFGLIKQRSAIGMVLAVIDVRSNARV